MYVCVYVNIYIYIYIYTGNKEQKHKQFAEVVCTCIYATRHIYAPFAITIPPFSFVNSACNRAIMANFASSSASIRGIEMFLYEYNSYLMKECDES